MEWLSYLLMALFGLIIGSFLNVVIYRYPLMLMEEWRQEALKFLDKNLTPTMSSSSYFNLFTPRSHCPKCQQKLKSYHNIPLVSYFVLKGHCAYCQKPIAWRYPLVEILAMLFSLLCYVRFGFTPSLGFSLVYSFGLICLFFIDTDHQILPDALLYTLLWLGLIANTLNLFTSIQASIYGALLAYLMLWLIAKAYWLWRKKWGMGHGDFKMLAVIGAWSGWIFVPITLLIACLLSLIVNGLRLINQRMHFDQPVAFGPYLAISGFLVLLCQQPILRFVLPLFLGLKL